MSLYKFSDNLNSCLIKVIGIGNSGGNAVNRMINSNIQNVEFIVANTDVKALSLCKALNKIQIGSKLTRGLGAGANPDIGEKAAMEDKEKIAEALKGADMIFIATGMGGGTGTGAALVIADIAKETGALVVGVITKPFRFEGKQRMEKADKGCDLLVNIVDTLIILPNQNLLFSVDTKTSFKDAFLLADRSLCQGVQGIFDIITFPGLVKVDFADVKAIMGIGTGEGKNKAVEAVKIAIFNLLLKNITMDDIKGVLVNVTGGNDFSLSEYEEIATLIATSVDKKANIIIGTAIDSTLHDEVRVTIIASGYENLEIKEEENYDEEIILEDKMLKIGNWKLVIVIGVGVGTHSLIREIIDLAKVRLNGSVPEEAIIYVCINHNLEVLKFVFKGAFPFLKIKTLYLNDTDTALPEDSIMLQLFTNDKSDDDLDDKCFVGAYV